MQVLLEWEQNGPDRVIPEVLNQKVTILIPATT